MDPVGFVASLLTLVDAFRGIISLISKYARVPQYVSELMESIFESQQMFKLLHNDIHSQFVIEPGDPRLQMVEKQARNAKCLLRKLFSKMDLPGMGKRLRRQSLLSKIQNAARMVYARLSWIISEEETKKMYRSFRTCTKTLSLIHQSLAGEAMARVEILMGATLLQHLSDNPSRELPKPVLEALVQSLRPRQAVIQTPHESKESIRPQSKAEQVVDKNDTDETAAKVGGGIGAVGGAIAFGAIGGPVGAVFGFIWGGGMGLAGGILVEAVFGS